MPYGSADDVPAYVPKARRDAWRKIWNNAYQECQSKKGSDCEGYAFRVANGVVKKLKKSLVFRRQTPS